MRVVVLRTFSNSCDPIFRPLTKLGFELKEIVYDMAFPVGTTKEEQDIKRKVWRESYLSLPGVVSSYDPDWVLMLGCHEGNNALVPPVEVLAEINRHCKLVHLCCDGGDSAWWPQLEKYNKHRAVTLHVNIDGVKEGVFDGSGFIDVITGLCPIDPGVYLDPPKPWDERPIKLGFRGGWGTGHPRGNQIQPIIDAGILHGQLRDGEDYSEYVDFMSHCKCVLNHAANGTGDRMHVKARVIETALAGALLIESANSPTKYWFDPGADYLQYSSLGDIEAIISWVKVFPDRVNTMIGRMRRKVLRDHSPKVFWSNVMERAGIR